MDGEMIYRLQGLGGFAAIGFIAWLTGRRERVDRKTIIGCLLLIWVMGGLVFWFPPTREALGIINNLIVGILDSSRKGMIFLFGPLALGPGESLPGGGASIGVILATQMLPAVIFFSALIAGLYHLGIMQRVVRLFARLFRLFLDLSGAESLCAAANIFVGIESGIAVRPFIERMTRSELLTILTCMMATVASTVMAVYVFALKDLFPQIAGHLVSASIISIPCAVLVSKLALPERERPETMGGIPVIEEAGAGEGGRSANLMTALIEGGAKGVQLAVSIGVLLVVLLGLEGVMDLVLGYLPAVAGEPLSLGRLLGWLVRPFVILLGLRPEEWRAAGEILGARFVETEVTAYIVLADLQRTLTVFSPRGLVIMMYSLCGFVHLASMGIFVGGLTALAPSRTKEITLLGGWALWLAFLATLLTGCVAGVLYF